jgi:hypothetical protein
MLFKFKQFLPERLIGQWDLGPDFTGQCCHDIFHTDIMVGMNDVETGIQGIDDSGNFIDGLIMLHQVIYTGYDIP